MHCMALFAVDNAIQIIRSRQGRNDTTANEGLWYAQGYYRSWMDVVSYGMRH